MIKTRKPISAPNNARATISDGTAVTLTLDRGTRQAWLYSPIPVNFSVGSDKTDGSEPAELFYHPGLGQKLIALTDEFTTIYAIRVNGGQTGVVTLEETDLPEGVAAGEFRANAASAAVPTDYAGQSSIVTLGNVTAGRVLPQIVSAASSTTPTPNADTTDLYILTALAAGATFGAPTGTPVNGQRLGLRIKDNGTARTLAFNAAYRAGTDVALPTTTVLGKTMYLEFIYNSADSKWDLIRKVDNI